MAHGDTRWEDAARLREGSVAKVLEKQVEAAKQWGSAAKVGAKGYTPTAIIYGTTRDWNVVRLLACKLLHFTNYVYLVTVRN